MEEISIVESVVKKNFFPTFLHTLEFWQFSREKYPLRDIKSSFLEKKKEKKWTLTLCQSRGFTL